jgi:hypothetical protein
MNEGLSLSLEVSLFVSLCDDEFSSLPHEISVPKQNIRAKSIDNIFFIKSTPLRFCFLFLPVIILTHEKSDLLIFTKPSHSKWKILHFAQKMGTFGKEKSAKFVQYYMQKVAFL